MKPHSELPGDLEHRERGAVIAGKHMIRRISCAPEFTEKLVNLVRQDTPVAQAVQQFILTLLRLLVEAHIRGRGLGKHLGKLTQLEQAGVRVFRKVTLGQHPDAQELLIMRAQLRKVTGQSIE